MAITFNSVLRTAGLDPADVRLLRHKDNRADPGRGPYHLWLNEPSDFLAYQSTQSISKRAILRGPYWATFVATPEDDTLFVGIWSASYSGLNSVRLPWPTVKGKFDETGTVDTYRLTPTPLLDDMKGRLIIDWSVGQKSWVQYADRRDKLIVELRRVFKEEPFPGYLRFRSQLSLISKLPQSWRTILSIARGVYLLTCPRTREQYVGSASGANGFIGRWDDYAQNGHGGDVALKSRELSDYQISILEVAGSSATTVEIITMEELWKRKLQSKEMGLNR
ncbi:GIY-YIG nuclease family protein [Xanthobacter versatilis]|uniref:GIY-YIG nuclease family protein n=1 Tax=Xanthobacter autotrophicus (strain ATCC BAA-1158 / Py2) TaxID=78245 RepID=UPI00372B1549